MGHATSAQGRSSASSSSGDRSFTLAADGEICWKTNREPSVDDPRLTRRQNEFMATYIRNPSWKIVAYVLGVSEQTAKNHSMHIKERLGTSSLIESYRELGWLVAP